MVRDRLRVCLVEPCAAHAEVLFPLIELLRRDYDVHTIAPRRTLDLDLLSDTRHLYTAWPLNQDYPDSRWRGFVGLLAKYRDIRRTLREVRPDFVLFNSTYRRFERLLIALSLGRYPKGQIIHEFQQYLKPGGRWLYERFDVNLVISEQVHKYVRANHPEFADLEYVLPIFFGGFLEAAGDQRPESKPSAAQGEPGAEGRVKLAVVGNIDAWRRDYRGLLDAVAATATRDGTQPGYELFLVGRAQDWLKDEVRRRKLEPAVRIFDEHVPFKEMFRLVREMDLLLFLIDSSVSNAQFYNRYKITGTSVLAKAFDKAVASSTDFLVDESLAGRCFYYAGPDLGSLLIAINEGGLTAADVAEKLRSSPLPAGMDFEGQRAKLARSIAAVVARR